MLELTNISFIKDILSKNGFTFSKSLGQNFLINPSVCPKMAELSGCEGIGVLEIGPGIGVLTKELATRAKKVVCVELDQRLKPVLETTLGGFDNVEVVFGDVLKIDLKELIEEKFGGMDLVVCANLPYYITSPVIMELLESRLPFKSITVMVQKEAAHRICAKVGSRESGAITASLNYYAAATKLFSVERGSFMPSPNVDSAVMRLDLHQQAPVDVKDEKLFFRVIKAAFSQRRKNLPNSLSSGLPFPKETIKEALQKCGISLNARAEEMELQQFADIANAFVEE